MGLAVLMAALWGCAEVGDDTAPEVTIRVEDGVTIVENPGLEFADSTSWSIDPEPILEIGELEGPPCPAHQ